MDPLKTEKKKTSWFRKLLRRIFLLLILVVVIFIFVRWFFVFGTGAKAGQLNFIVKKGYVFKTYEGRMILTGYKSNMPGSIQSNEFEFSVVDKRIADTLMLNSGAFFELHYKQYLGSLPWRGMSSYIVDSILSIKRNTDLIRTIVP